MIKRNVTANLLLSLCTALALESRASANEVKGSGAKSKPVVIVEPGGSSSVCLSWSDGTGRLPVIFISDRPILTNEARTGIDGKPRWEGGGLVAEYDEKESGRVQKLINEIGLSTVGQSRDSQGQTVAVIRVSTHGRTQRTARSLFVHIVSGTGRNMQLSAEFCVAVLVDLK